MESYVRIGGRSSLKNHTYPYMGVGGVRNCQNHPYIVNEWLLIMERFNGILFHKTGPASKQHISHSSWLEYVGTCMCCKFLSWWRNDHLEGNVFTKQWLTHAIMLTSIGKHYCRRSAPELTAFFTTCRQLRSDKVRHLKRCGSHNRQGHPDFTARHGSC